MQLELPSTPYPMILQMNQSTYADLVGTEEWRESIKSSIEQMRFDAIMKAMAESTKAITKTLVNAAEGIIKEGRY